MDDDVNPLGVDWRGHLELVAFYEACLAQHGDNYRGVGWTKSEEHAARRYRAALDVVQPHPNGRVTLLDFGCGASHLYEYMRQNGEDRVTYSGLDLSPEFLELSRRKHPHLTYFDTDVLVDDSSLPSFDYVVMNGVFTYKGQVSFNEMWSYCQALLTRMFSKTRIGMAFNFMSKQVEWERDDLFHVPLDLIADFSAGHLTRNFTIRHDYGLFEYMVHVYREPLIAASSNHALGRDTPQ